MVSWNAAAIDGRRRTALAFGDHARDERRRVEHEPVGDRAGDRNGVVVDARVGAIDRASHRFELDRGLRLVA